MLINEIFGYIIYVIKTNAKKINIFDDFPKFFNVMLHLIHKLKKIQKSAILFTTNAKFDFLFKKAVLKNEELVYFCIFFSFLGHYCIHSGCCTKILKKIISR